MPSTAKLLIMPKYVRPFIVYVSAGLGIARDAAKWFAGVKYKTDKS